MTRVELDREFAGDEYGIGRTYGADGFNWHQAARSVRAGMKRDLTAREWELFVTGWLQGWRDREKAPAALCDPAAEMLPL